MATTPGKARCITCDKEKSAVRCEGCQQIFCYSHLADHRQELGKQLDEIEVNRDLFRQTLTEQTTDTQKNSYIKQIDEWEKDSIKKIQQTAEECKQLLYQHISENITQIEVNLTKLTDQIRQIRQENDYNEIDLNQVKEMLRQLTEELDKPSTISIQQDYASPVNKISVVISSEKFRRPSNQSHEEQHIENELTRNEKDSIDQAYITLKTSYTQIEKRCVKHQKSEIEVKRQLTVCQSSIEDLKREIQDLNERLSFGAEEYKTLFRKYNILVRSLEMTDRQGKTDNKETKISSTRPLRVNADGEVRQCPMCSWEFPKSLTFDHKNEHIESHFQ